MKTSTMLLVFGLLIIVGYLWLPWTLTVLEGEGIDLIEAIQNIQIPKIQVDLGRGIHLIRALFWITILYWLLELNRRESS